MAGDGVVLWPPVCSNGTDEGVWWNGKWTFNTSSPDLTDCFQQTALVWTECGFLWLSSLIYIPYLLCSPTLYRTSTHQTRLFTTKVLLTLSLLGVSLANLIYILVAWQSGVAVPIFRYLQPAVYILTFILACLLHRLEFIKGVHTSGIFFLFWMLMLLLDIFPFASYMIQAVGDPRKDGLRHEEGIDDVFLFSTFYIHYGLVIAQFITSLFVDIPEQNTDASWATVGWTRMREHHYCSVNRPWPHQHTRMIKDPCPENTCSFLYNITHSWIIPLLIKGYKRPLTFDDLPDIMDKEKAAGIVQSFQEEWERQVQPKQNCCGQLKSDPSFLKALIAACWYPFVVSGVARFIVVFAEFLNPALLQLVMECLGGDDPNYMWKGLALGFIVILVNVWYTIWYGIYIKQGAICAMNIRSCLTGLIYRKALKLTPGSRKTTTVGEIVNLMSVDAQKIHDTFGDIHEIWACPLTCIVAVYYLWQVMGPSALAGLALLLIMMPIAGYWQVQKFTTLQEDQMLHKDHRIRLINEILTGIKVLKMYAWETSFLGTVSEARRNELKALRSQAYLLVGIGVTWFCAPTLVSLAVFATYILISPDNYLDPSKAFVSLSVIQVLNFSLSFLAIWLAFLAQAFTSMKRISRVLLEPELDEDAVKQDPRMDKALKVEDATFSWGPDENPTLKNIHMEVDDGDLVAIVGTVGVGKSTLIQALLGETHTIKGRVKMRGSVAYVAQQAWIQNDTLKNNILFGKKLDDNKYEKIINACALNPDFAILPGGDQTEIGEKGINLSGGQKQRVNLARAVYQNEDIYLFDDPLSAVDAHVAKHLFEEVIGPNGLLKRKTRVLVTHGLTYLPYVDKIVVLIDGEISETGTYKELMGHAGAFAEFVRQYLREIEADEDKEEADEELPQEELDELKRQLSAMSESGDWAETPEGTPSPGTSPTKSPQTKNLPTVRRHRLSRHASGIEEADRLDAKDVQEQLEKLQAQKLIEEESAKVGAIKWSVITAFVKSCGAGMALCVLFGLIAYVVSMTLTQIWLSAWSDDPVTGTPEDRAQSKFRLGVYGGYTAFQMFSVGCIAFFNQMGCLHASKVLHSNLLFRILRAPMAFFDTTPLGRIINRFSTDMDKVDTTIPQYLRWFLYNCAQVVATVIIISYSTPWFLLAVPFLVAFFSIIQRVYMAGVRQMKRIDSIRRSPIYTNFDETLVGVTCIRAFKQQDRFVAKNDELIDNSQIAWYPVVICQRWLGVWLDVMGAMIIFIAILLAVLARDTITPGLAGLSVSIAMQSFWCITMLVRGATELETHIVSVERIKEYSEVPSEAAWEIEAAKPDVSWPSEGNVEFSNYSTRYRPGLDYVLKDLSFSISSREKVGIVGRTGAGKSSMALSLFRIIESAKGRIIIDNLDISTMGLHDLRSKLTIIPQDPVLFSGTLRRNMDPFEAYSDEAIWRALELAHLKTFAESLSEGLNYECGEGGQALSIGQRQLVCLARALLRRTRVLLLDEATAAVDLETDELIQTTIRTAFEECTVLTIAHRINTIMDYDRVLVLDAGRIKEFGSPNEFLKQPESAFYGLAKDAGLV